MLAPRIGPLARVSLSRPTRSTGPGGPPRGPGGAYTRAPRAARALVALGAALGWADTAPARAQAPFAAPERDTEAPPGPAAAPPPDRLWDPPVVTPAGQAMRVSESPSTTFVIGGEELRRMGATSLPEILRRVPGMDVRQLSASDGQIGPRGFAYDHADRVLVLIDGRTAFLDFSGATTYEMLPVSLADIERIEVVMGPGAAVYGNKAMLGVVNIITRSAIDYPWAEARLDAGTPGDGRVGVRWGALRGDWSARVTGLGRRLTLFDPPAPGIDTGRAGMAGGGTAAVTYQPAPNRELSLDAGVMHGRTTIMPTGASLVPFDATLAHARLVGRYGLGGPGSPRGDVHVQAGWNGGFIDSRHFLGPGAPFDATFHTPYADVSHALRFRALDLPMEGRWGGAFRLNVLRSNITRDEQTLVNVAGFASNTLILGRWRATAGVRVDRQTLTHTNVSPRVSLVFTPRLGHQVRLAFNTGYNNPNAIHNFARLQVGVPLYGTPDLRAERITYGELAYAGAPTAHLRLFVNLFAYRMTRWISLDPTRMVGGGFAYANNAGIDGVGGEAGFDWTCRWIDLYAHYATVDLRGQEPDPYRIENFGSPRHKVGAGLRLRLPASLYLSADGQYVGRTEVAAVPAEMPVPTLYRVFPVEAYVASYARIGFVHDGLDVSLAAANLLDDRTAQFAGSERPARRLMLTVGYFQ